MLVLMRKPSEVIHIGNDIRVVVTKIRGNCVYVGIEAPKETIILRGEVKERIENGGEAKLPPKENRGKARTDKREGAQSPAQKGSFGRVLETAMTTLQEEVVAISGQATQ